MTIDPYHYANPPDDPGVFVPNYTIAELDCESKNGIYRFKCPKRDVYINIDGCAYFIIVGGGYRGFKKRSNATNDLKYRK